MDKLLDFKFTPHVAKFEAHLSTDVGRLETLHRQLESYLASSKKSLVQENLRRLVCSISNHGNLDSHSLMESCIFTQAAKAQNILNVKRLQDRTSDFTDGRILPKLETSRLYKNEVTIWARAHVSSSANLDELMVELQAHTCIPIAKNVVEFQWPYRKRSGDVLVLLLNDQRIERLIFYSDLAYLKDLCPDRYVVWSNLISFYYCYINGTVDVHVESPHDWDCLLSVAIMTRLFLDKSNLRIFGGDDSPIACMSGYNPYRSLRKLAGQPVRSAPLDLMGAPEANTPVDQGLVYPVYELAANRDLQSVTGKSSIGGLNSTEIIFHHVR